MTNQTQTITNQPQSQASGASFPRGRVPAQDPTHRYTNPSNQWNQYHKSADWPDRLIAIGDAVCVFNPVYGQGLTVAAMEADLLHRMLARRRASGKDLNGLGRRYQRAAAHIVFPPWILATSSDLMWDPQHQPTTAKIAHWYNARLFSVCVRDPKVWARFVRTLNMVAPPTTLFHPTVIAKVIRQALSNDQSRHPDHHADGATGR